jgi:hypothetical protein
MVHNAVAHLKSEVEPSAVALQLFHHAQALLIVRKIGRKAFAQYVLARVTEGRMTKVMPERNRFGEVFVEEKRTRHSPRYLRYLESMSKARSVMVNLRAEENLSFVHKTAKRLAVGYSVAVALKFRAHTARLYWEISPLRFRRKRGKRRKRFSFSFVHKLAHRHKHRPFRHNLHVFLQHTILYERKLKNPFYFFKFF